VVCGVEGARRAPQRERARCATRTTASLGGIASAIRAHGGRARLAKTGLDLGAPQV